MTLSPNTQITQENVEAKAMELHAAADFVGKSTWHGGGTNRGHWRNQAKIALGIKPDPRRPALSPPAEGEVCICTTRGDGAEGCGLCNETGIRQTPMHRNPADATVALGIGTPTPAPVDWERVGPKLVEAVEKARDHYDMMTRLANGGVVYEVNPDTRKRIRRKLSEVIATEADAGSKHCRAALAATQPQSNGE